MKSTQRVLQSALGAVLLSGWAAGQPVNRLGGLEHQPRAEVRTRPAAPASFRLGVSPPAPYRLAAVRQVDLDAVERHGQLPMIGIERRLDAAMHLRGEWLALNEGRAAWRLAIQSEGATGVRVHFHDFAVGTGSVWVYSEDRSQVFGPYTGSGIDGTGDFWSHLVFADTVVVEYLAEQRAEALPFSITGIAHLMSPQEAMSAGACELDVTCYSPWGANASGVGMYIFQSGGGTYACSGALLNNSRNDSKPYFLTANHCISSAAAAQTVEVFWKYQTAVCNGTPPTLSSLPVTLGATFLVGAPIPSGDFSLLVLSQLPNVKLTFYGWNASGSAVPMGGAVAGVHHPQGDYTRIVFGSRSPDAAAQIGSDLAPAGMFYQVQATSGRIEPGSSGSPLFTPDQAIVGTLTYGPSGNACSISPFTAGYGRFSAAYPSLAQYLSPAASGGGTAPPAATVTSTPASVKVNWSIQAPAPAIQTIQLSTTAAAGVTISAKASQSWIVLSASSLTLVPSSPAVLSVALNTTAFTAAGTYTGAITLTGPGISASIPVELDVAAAPAAVTGGQSTLIPWIEDGSGAATTFTLLNPYPSATAASVSFFSAGGVPMPVATLGGASSAWQNLTIPAYGTATITTSGTSSPQKQGFAVVQTGDTTKRVLAAAKVGLDLVSSSLPMTPPFAIPFDATANATTMLYLYNPSATVLAGLGLSVYNSSGSLVGTGQLVVPPNQQGTVIMAKSMPVFGGQKGMLYITGASPVWSMGVQVGGDGPVEMVQPAGNR